eukprot:TRINITY_DN20227_c0_g1_i1.p1 TRINITY_DN20227_c0_g1~~TRINITY_DN20227_c0_g1_i1.p1  ORF type:complete len:142 (+),score=23.71 TRINITY_DN20227_c0_g1_i1:197-622(+)
MKTFATPLVIIDLLSYSPIVQLQTLVEEQSGRIIAQDRRDSTFIFDLAVDPLKPIKEIQRDKGRKGQGTPSTLGANSIFLPNNNCAAAIFRGANQNEFILRIENFDVTPPAVSKRAGARSAVRRRNPQSWINNLLTYSSHE